MLNQASLGRFANPHDSTLTAPEIRMPRKCVKWIGSESWLFLQ